MILNILVAGMKREIKDRGLIGFFYVSLEFFLSALTGLKHKTARTIYRFYSPIVIRKINGSKMYLDLQKKGIYEDLFASGKREIFLTSRYPQFKSAKRR